jgi:hypothetical protein
MILNFKVKDNSKTMKQQFQIKDNSKIQATIL